MTGRLETRSAYLWLHADGMLMVQSRSVHETRDDAMETVRASFQLLGSTRPPMMVDARALLSQDKAAGLYYRNSLTSIVVLCAAYVIPSRIGSVIGNIFMPKKNEVPVRLFNDTEAAMAWLKLQVQKQELKARANPR